jgi:hypothetical protein
MTQLLRHLNQVFGNQSKINDLEHSMTPKILQAFKTIKNRSFDIYDAWIEARLQQTKYYNKHHHIE